MRSLKSNKMQAQAFFLKINECTDVYVLYFRGPSVRLISLVVLTSTNLNDHVSSQKYLYVNPHSHTNMTQYSKASSSHALVVTNSIR